MPFIGSVSGNGENIIGSATASSEWRALVFPAVATSSTQALRCENLSRVSAVITATLGGVGATGVLEVRISNTFYPVQNFAVAGIGTPVTVEQHIACKDVRVSITNPQGVDATLDILIMATATS
tara:strand:- start:508 stop:879 length:372 start_codon:yes stop_codon:yes gene_type:complete